MKGNKFKFEITNPLYLKTASELNEAAMVIIKKRRDLNLLARYLSIPRPAR